MSQKNVELIFGKLATDEEFRRRFCADPTVMLSELADRGMDLTKAEMAALLATDACVFDRVADAIDPRLQKACLKATQTPASKDGTPGSERRSS